MPPKDIPKSSGAGAVPAPSPAPAVAPAASASAGETTLLMADGETAHQSPTRPVKRAGPDAHESPKKMVRNIVNISLSEWMARCPEGSPAGLTGSGSTFAVIIEQLPTVIVVTRKDHSRMVAKKTIIIGDDTGNQAELSIWGNFAARSWMHPEGSVILFKNVKFNGYYLSKMQLTFADQDPAHELLISKAIDSLDITKKLKSWYSSNGTTKKLLIDDVAKKPKTTMVSFYGVIIEHIVQSAAPDEMWILVGDESRDITVKVVATPGYDRTDLLESVGQTILFKHVYVLNASTVFFDDMGAIPSAYQLHPPGAEHLLAFFKASDK